MLPFILPFFPKRIYRPIRAHIARRNANSWLRRQGVLKLAVKVAERFYYTVQSGPFKGLKYTKEAVISRHATPALIGEYERQIYPALAEFVGRAELVIDIGHAEGYYALGLAMLGKPVIAFDADPHERRVCREMAEENGLSISIRRWCSPETLRTLVSNKRALIISDIEGGELDLFTPEVITDLRDCDLIVELHAESAEQNGAFALRFATTHTVQVIDHPREPAGVELVSFLGGHDARRMATEYRGFQQWMIARAHHQPPPSEINLRTSAISPS